MPTVAYEKVFASPFQPSSSVCGDSDVGEHDGKVTEVDWKHAVDCLRKQNARFSIKECVSVGSTALHAGHILGDVVCPCCGVTQLEGPDKPADNYHASKHCGHAWESDTVCTANPLASLRPYLSD